jgi:hypothetical protein
MGTHPAKDLGLAGTPQARSPCLQGNSCIWFWEQLAALFSFAALLERDSRDQEAEDSQLCFRKIPQDALLRKLFRLS